MKGKLPQTSSIFATSQDDISDVIVPWVQIQNRQHLMMRFPHCVGNMTTWRHKVNGKSKPVSQMMSLRIFKKKYFLNNSEANIDTHEWNIFPDVLFDSCGLTYMIWKVQRKVLKKQYSLTKSLSLDEKIISNSSEVWHLAKASPRKTELNFEEQPAQLSTTIHDFIELSREVQKVQQYMIS